MSSCDDLLSASFPSSTSALRYNQSANGFQMSRKQETKYCDIVPGSYAWVLYEGGNDLVDPDRPGQQHPTPWLPAIPPSATTHLPCRHIKRTGIPGKMGVKHKRATEYQEPLGSHRWVTHGASTQNGPDQKQTRRTILSASCSNPHGRVLGYAHHS